MLTLQWIDEQIERLRHSTETMQNARDFALMCIARDSIQGKDSPALPLVKSSTGPPPLATIADIESALARFAASTPEERQRAEDARTWARMMSKKV